jgi:hypothetical protein
VRRAVALAGPLSLLAVFKGLLVGPVGHVAAAPSQPSWEQWPSPNPVSYTDVSLVGVSCSTTSACMTVGDYNNGTHPQTLIERWNGTVGRSSQVLMARATPSSMGCRALRIRCAPPLVTTAGVVCRTVERDDLVDRDPRHGVVRRLAEWGVVRHVLGLHCRWCGSVFYEP